MIFIVLAVVAGLLICFYARDKAERDLIQFIASVLGWGAAVYGAYYAGQSLHLKIKQDKRVESFKILDKLNNQEFVGVRNLMEKKLKARRRISNQTLYAMVNRNAEFYNSVILLLGLLEDTSIAIQEDYVDEEVLYKSLSNIVATNWDDLSGYIEHYRERAKDKTLWIEFEKLHDSWKKRKRLGCNKSLPNLVGP